MGAVRQGRCGQPEPGRPALGVQPERMCLLWTDGNVVCNQEQPSLVLVEGQVISSDFPHLAGKPGCMERQDRITACCDDNASHVIGQMQRILQQPVAAVALRRWTSSMISVTAGRLRASVIRPQSCQLSVVSTGSSRTTGPGVWSPLLTTAWSCHSPPGADTSVMGSEALLPNCRSLRRVITPS